MEMLESLGHGFAVAFQPMNLFWCFAGVFLGTIVGVLPGIGPSASIAILIPITFGMDPTSALIMMCGIYYGNATAPSLGSPSQAGELACTS